MNNPCPCGSDNTYEKCCGVYIEGGKAPTAKDLMKSRYAAYVKQNEQYLLDTWHPSTRPEKLNFGQDSAKWFNLKISSTTKGGENDDEGTVEFVARFKLQGKGDGLHEVSQFSKVDGCWYYVGGIVS